MQNAFKIWKTVEAVCDKYADKMAVRYKEQCVTYEELYVLVMRWRHVLQSVGIHPGVKVLVMNQDPLVFLCLCLALWSMHCTIIPIDEEVPYEKMERVVDSCECQYIVSKEAYMDFVKYEGEGNVLYVRCYEENINSERSNVPIIFFTSGTTGESKGVVFSDQAFWSNIRGLCECVGFHRDDIVYTPLKISLTAAMTTAVLPTLFCGATLVLTPSKTPAVMWKVIRDNRVTILFAVPYVYDMLAKTQACVKEKHLRICLTCSAYLDSRIYQAFFRRTNCAIHSIYCSSEAGVISYVSSHEEEKLMHTVGKTIFGVRIRIVDDKGEILSDDGVGQIEVQGCNMAVGYYKHVELTQKVFEGGWVKTGDLGYIDLDGYIHLVGRINDVLNISGHMVGAPEIERVINEYPQVKDSLVYARTDNYSHQSLACYVVLNDTSQLFDKEAFFQFCSMRLQSYEIPRKIEVVEELPRSLYGKKKRILEV